MEDELLPVGDDRPLVLVVDDHVMLLQSIAIALRQRGYHVVAAEGGAAGIAELEADTDHEIEFLVTDLAMPRISGRMVVSRARELRTDLGIVCMSAYIDEGDTLMGLLGPDTSFISKPFEADALVAKLEQLRRSLRGEATPNPDVRVHWQLVSHTQLRPVVADLVARSGNCGVMISVDPVEDAARVPAEYEMVWVVLATRDADKALEIGREIAAFSSQPAPQAADLPDDEGPYFLCVLTPTVEE